MRGGRFGWGSGWVAAPAYDEEHPEELSYRPFPIGPLLTASPREPVFADLVHHDVSRTIDMLDQPGSALPLRFRPGEQMAQLMWANQFRGDPIGLAKLFEAQASDITSSSLANRNVRTTRRWAANSIDHSRDGGWPSVSLPADRSTAHAAHSAASMTCRIGRHIIQHAQRMHVGREDRLLLVAVRLALLPQADDLAQRLDVETDSFGLAETCREYRRRAPFSPPPASRSARQAGAADFASRPEVSSYRIHPTFARSTPPTRRN